MKPPKNTKGAPAADQKDAGKTESAPLQLSCKVLINGALIEGAHHSADKIFDLPQNVAEYHAGLNPPEVKILGTA